MGMNSNWRHSTFGLPTKGAKSTSSCCEVYLCQLQGLPTLVARSTYSSCSRFCNLCWISVLQERFPLYILLYIPIYNNVNRPSLRAAVGFSSKINQRALWATDYFNHQKTHE